MKAEDTFLTEAKPTATTTKERQIDFMLHLYREKYTEKEIASIYGVPVGVVDNVINANLKGKKIRQRNRANV